MEIRWSPEAAADFTSAIQYIRQDNSPAALRVARSIYESVAQLKKFPKLGRSGRVGETRELPLPKAAVCRGVSCKRKLRRDRKIVAWGAALASDRRVSQGFHSKND